MAVLGNKFVLLIDTNEIYCETQSSIGFTSQEISVRSETSGDWDEYLNGGRKSGTISFTGIMFSGGLGSAFDLAENKIGMIWPFAWGGTEEGQEVIIGNMYLRTLNIDSSVGQLVTFSGDAVISGSPTFGTVIQTYGLVDENEEFITDDDNMIMLID